MGKTGVSRKRPSLPCGSKQRVSCGVRKIMQIASYRGACDGWCIVFFSSKNPSYGLTKNSLDDCSN